jgi:MFS transporter, putative metabolite:H+ symporter
MTPDPNHTPRRYGGVDFHRPVPFWLGAAALTVGVLLHFPDWLSMAPMHYQMAGMEMGPLMIAGMWLIVAGSVLATWGLLPTRQVARNRAARFHIHVIDDARLTGAHWGLMFVLGIALVIDVMKPATLAFVLPGMVAEYRIPQAQIGWLLVCALTGTTVGSVFWGVMADRIGRRAAILLASLMFMGTSICGTMPSYEINLFMCFVMGLAAGGMLPIVYALMAESVPAAQRGWLVVLHGGMGTVGGTLAAAGCALLLEPVFSWRALWLVNLPTGILMLILNRWIPESPRFLLEHGRADEARAVLARYGVELQEGSADTGDDIVPAPTSHWSEIVALFRRPHVTQTTVVIVYALAWGIVNWGFVAFLPTFLRGHGFGAGASSYLLFLSAFVAIPGTVLVAWMYGRWSSRRSMALFAVGSILSALAFAAIAPDAQTNRLVTIVVLSLIYTATGGVASMLSPYTAEVFPTRLRGTGSGLSAGSTKLGGLVGGVATVTGVIAVATGLMRPVLLVSVPMAVAALLVWRFGIETRGRRLEELAATSALTDR